MTWQAHRRKDRSSFLPTAHVVAVTLAAGLFGAACPSSAPPEPRRALVVHVQGTATVDQAEKTRVPLVAESIVEDRDVVHVGRTSFALLHLSNGWLTRIDADSDVRVGDLIAFGKSATTTSVADQLQSVLRAGERDRLPPDQVFVERVAGMQTRLHAATSVGVQTSVSSPEAAARGSRASSERRESNAAGLQPAVPGAPRADESVAGGTAKSEQDVLPPTSKAEAGLADEETASAADSGSNRRGASPPAPPPPPSSPAAPSESKADLSRAPARSSVDAGYGDAGAAKGRASTVKATVRLLDAASGEAPAGKPTMDALRGLQSSLAGCSSAVGVVVRVNLKVGVDGVVQQAHVALDGNAGEGRCVRDVVVRQRLPRRDRAVDFVIEVRFVAAGGP
jgi:hypothetical protein